MRSATLGLIVVLAGCTQGASANQAVGPAVEAPPDLQFLGAVQDKWPEFQAAMAAVGECTSRSAECADKARLALARAQALSDFAHAANVSWRTEPLRLKVEAALGLIAAGMKNVALSKEKGGRDAADRANSQLKEAHLLMNEAMSLLGQALSHRGSPPVLLPPPSLPPPGQPSRDAEAAARSQPGPEWLVENVYVTSIARDEYEKDVAIATVRGDIGTRRGEWFRWRAVLKYRQERDFWRLEGRKVQLSE